MQQMTRCGLGICILIVLLTQLPCAAQSTSKVDWKPLSWIIGDWIGAGGGGPGQGSGEFSFHPDLQGQVIVRKSFSEYPATADKPAYRHDDLMIVYPAGKSFSADYFDNEGHVIRYAVDVSGDGNTITLVSEESPGPRFRLTYTRLGEKALLGKFEIAPPGKPDAFAKYLEWTANKQSGK